MGRSRKQNNEKSRNFCFVIYPDNERHVKCVEYLKEYCYDFLLVKHDRDLTKDADEKKVHWHVLLRFENPRHRDSIVNELDIEDNLVFCCASWNGYAKYMTHCDYPDKAQYNLSEFSGSVRALNDLKNLFEKRKSKDMRVKELRDFINSSNIICLDDLVVYADSINKTDLILGNTYFFVRLIEDHNYRIRETYNIFKSFPDEWIERKEKKS